MASRNIDLARSSVAEPRELCLLQRHSSGLLLLAVEDVHVDGERLEAVGVAPTIEVQADPASMGRGDPQLNRAIAVLSRT